METLNQIKIDECGSLEPNIEFYLCTGGRVTWGFGRNFQDNPPNGNDYKRLYHIIKTVGNNKEAYKGWAEYLFLNDVDDAYNSLSRCVGSAWKTAPEQARIIAINMRFNMGPNFNNRKWPQFFRCFKKHDWAGCAVQMRYTDVTKTKESIWYGQVDNHKDDFVGRSERLVLAMKTLA